MTTIRIPMTPRVAPRPRVRRDGRAYMPPEYRVWKEQAALLLSQALRNAEIPCYEGPIRLSILLYRDAFRLTITPAESDSKSGFRGDIDNYAKAIMDACEAGRVFENDRQVTHLTVRFANP